MMRPISRLRLLVLLILSFLASQTIGHPRPVASTLITTVELQENGHQIDATTASGFTGVEGVAGTNFRRRNIGFQHFLEIGNGWNMYYSSWPSVALPVRKWQFDYRTPADVAPTPFWEDFETRRPYSATRQACWSRKMVVEGSLMSRDYAEPAAWALTNLYSTVLVSARGKWATGPPQHLLRFTYGGISILMHCPEKPIPWLFIGNFAERLLQLTAGGWTGAYQVMLSQAETEVSIGVSLTIIN